MVPKVPFVVVGEGVPRSVVFELGLVAQLGLVVGKQYTQRYWHVLTTATRTASPAWGYPKAQRGVLVLTFTVIAAKGLASGGACPIVYLIVAFVIKVSVSLAVLVIVSPSRNGQHCATGEAVVTVRAVEGKQQGVRLFCGAV